MLQGSGEAPEWADYISGALYPLNELNSMHLGILRTAVKAVCDSESIRACKICSIFNCTCTVAVHTHSWILALYCVLTILC